MSFQQLYQQWVQNRTHPIWQHNPKTAGRALAQSLGIPVPTLYGSSSRTEALPEIMATAPGPFVIKPNNGSTARGVIPLTWHEEGYRCLWTDKVQSGGAWTREMVAQVQRDTGGHSDTARAPWLVEQAIMDGDRLSDDIRVYVVGGTVAWVHRSRRDKGKARWYANWDRVGSILPQAQVDYTAKMRREYFEHDRPVWFPYIVEDAEAVAATVCAPFVRVDFYTDAAEHYFGELTPCPGPLTKDLIRLSPYVDKLCVDLWPSKTEVYP
jgi:hypothetical protein